MLTMQLVQDRSDLHTAVLCSGHCQHLPLRPHHPLERNLPVRGLYADSGALLVLIDWQCLRFHHLVHRNSAPSADMPNVIRL